MSQGEAKQSNLIIYFGNDNEGTYLLLSWPSVILSLVKGKQSCLHMYSWHFWSIYLLVKILPKDLAYQLSFQTKRQQFLNAELLWVCVTFSRAKKTHIKHLTMFLFMERLIKTRDVCFQVALIFGQSHFLSSGSLHVIMIQFCSLWNLWQHSHRQQWF